MHNYCFFRYDDENLALICDLFKKLLSIHESRAHTTCHQKPNVRRIFLFLLLLLSSDERESNKTKKYTFFTRARCDDDVKVVGRRK